MRVVYWFVLSTCGELLLVAGLLGIGVVLLSVLAQPDQLTSLHVLALVTAALSFLLGVALRALATVGEQMHGVMDRLRQLEELFEEDAVRQIQKQETDCFRARQGDVEGAFRGSRGASQGGQ